MVYPIDVPALIAVATGLQLLGLFSAVIARVYGASRAGGWLRRIFFGSLTVAGTGSMAIARFVPTVWGLFAFTVPLMVIIATFDAGGARAVK